MSVIKSVGYTNTEILQNILNLHTKSTTFDLDPTYSKGNFYKDVPCPKYIFDLVPQTTNVKRADCCNLPLGDNSLTSIVFDPPFMFGHHGQTKSNIMNRRFTMFNTYSDLVIMYRQALQEFYRLLKRGGILVFKCQDYTDSRTTMTHCLVYNWATELGFYAKDIFILVATGGRIYNSKLNQRHARKFHCYFWVFQK